LRLELCTGNRSAQPRIVPFGLFSLNSKDLERIAWKRQHLARWMMPPLSFQPLRPKTRSKRQSKRYPQLWPLNRSTGSQRCRPPFSSAWWSTS
jgi:hypothetical protein